MLAALFSSFFESYLPSHKILRRFKIDFREFPEHRSKKTAPYFIFVYVWNEKKGRNQHAQFLSSSPSSCSLRVRCFPCSLVLKVELVPPSLLRSPMFRLPSGLYFNACLGSLFVSILCTCCSHFFLYCFISFTMFCAPVFSLIHWFFFFIQFCYS